MTHAFDSKGGRHCFFVENNSSLSSWCLVMVEWLFLAVQRGCLQFVIVVFPNHTHYFFTPRCHGRPNALLHEAEGRAQ